MDTDTIRILTTEGTEIHGGNINLNKYALALANHPGIPNSTTNLTNTTNEAVK
jgi:hypothetical protein